MEKVVPNQSETTTDGQQMIKFIVGNEKYAIPVRNVNEIIRPTKVTPIPRAHAYIEGITELRGDVYPVIDMEKILQTTKSNSDEDRFIIAEFSERKLVFHVHGVEQIFTAENIEKSTDMYGDVATFVIGVVKEAGYIILLLDYEAIIQELQMRS